MIELTHRHTLSLSSYCQNLFDIYSIDELDGLDFNQQHYLILGDGSNTAFIRNFNGDIISFRDQTFEISDEGDVWSIKAGAGLKWHQLVNTLTLRNIGGLENLALIPGTCGAAPVQNIGAYGVEFADFCHAVQCYDLLSRQRRVLSRQECQFGYRDSIFKRQQLKHLLITQVELRLPKDWHPNLTYRELRTLSTQGLTPAMVMQQVIAIRSSKLPDPNTLSNAGSFFKNPVVSCSQALTLKQQWSEIPLFPLEDGKVKLSAGWLIEQAGFKGKRHKNIGTYDKHALVIVNYGISEGEDLLTFIKWLRNAVYNLFSVELDNEVQLIDSEGTVSL